MNGHFEFMKPVLKEEIERKRRKKKLCLYLRGGCLFLLYMTEHFSYFMCRFIVSFTDFFSVLFIDLKRKNYFDFVENCFMDQSQRACFI